MSEFSQQRYDLLVLGAGVMGAAITRAFHERRPDLKIALLERGDLPSGASLNSLRIVHGGFRYLQRLQFGRALASLKAQSELLRLFPEVIAPLQCKLQLSGRGLKRPLTARIAILLFSLLRISSGGSPLPAAALDFGGSIISDKGSKRAILTWFDAVVRDPQRFLTLLKSPSCSYFPSHQISQMSWSQDLGVVTGLTVANERSAFTFSAPLVIDTRGVGIPDAVARQNGLRWCAGWNLSASSLIPPTAAEALESEANRLFFCVPRPTDSDPNGVAIGTGYTEIPEIESDQEDLRSLIAAPAAQFFEEFLRSGGRELINAGASWRLSDIGMIPWDGRSRDVRGDPIPIQRAVIHREQHGKARYIAIFPPKFTTALHTARRIVGECL